ncbi:tRNA1(Val) (adenine(37)-N6)-methyltransferase [Thioclava sp. JE_KL1]|uniref:tRNA1(Val) (adenine(37)-N6)-methyltransferase n=1 Tax=Thioclava sp. JE_KL1 TaxID=2651187 RepID=UPI00128D66C0|nr:methyltransferase [Thioclava sp. JE_KL1]MPQ92839.1 methyltransferase [Thioclava sp. JE_KL1]
MDRFGPDELTVDGFLGGRLRIAQPRAGYRAAMDPVLLAAACPAQAGQSVLELGCGAGVASLCLGWRVPGLAQSGMELQPAYADLARRNAAENGVALEVIEGDLAQMPADLRARSFDHVIANPPYFGPEDGTPAADPGRERAQREATPISAWLDAGLRRLKPEGRITLIQQADRLADLLVGLHGRTGAITVLPIAPRVGRTARRVIVTARKGARTPLQLLAPLILHSAPMHSRDAEDLTEIAREILREGQKLPIPR